MGNFMIIDNHPFQTENGHLMVGGVDAIELTKQYGTPLYAYDVSLIRDNCRAFVQTFERLGIKAQVAYASKAFSSIAMLQVMKQEHLSLDVVSEGELYTALQADFPVERIHLHGNNKSWNEMEMAIKNGIGCIVVDNFHDIAILDKLLSKYEANTDVLMRVTPGVEAATHQYILTGNEDSKFGFNLQNGQADRAFELLYHHERVCFKGLHCHIGSQIVETDRFLMATDRLFAQISHWNNQYGYTPKVLNLGGGFGIRYTEADHPLPLHHYVEELVHQVRQHVEVLSMPMPEIWLEPGRSIAGDAGVTLYTIGATKQIPGIRRYVSVDGGLTDNLRPALYQATYEAIIANKADTPTTQTVSIAGKSCESGDMLIWDLAVPDIDDEDVLAVFATGAYGYSMANHYNRFPKPAVVFVENGEANLVVARETYQDVVQHDLSYE